jgi:hypothetical protein
MHIAKESLYFRDRNGIERHPSQMEVFFPRVHQPTRSILASARFFIIAVRPYDCHYAAKLFTALLTTRSI